MHLRVVDVVAAQGEVERKKEHGRLWSQRLLEERDEPSECAAMNDVCRVVLDVAAHAAGARFATRVYRAIVCARVMLRRPAKVE